MKINVCYHLVTRQMEKTSLIFSFIGWVMLLEIEKLTFSVLCGSKKLQTNSIMKKMLISPANFSIYLRDWVRVHFSCSTVTWHTAVVPQGWSETCCHLSTFAKGCCRRICSPPGFSVQAFEKGSSYFCLGPSVNSEALSFLSCTLHLGKERFSYFTTPFCWSVLLSFVSDTLLVYFYSREM